MKTITIRVPDALETDLQKLAKSRHVSVGKLVRESVRWFVLAERFRQLRREAMPYAQAQGFLTDEDIFTKLK